MITCDTKPTATTLDELAARIRAAHAAFEAAAANALALALDAGDALIDAKSRVSGWQKFVTENCSLRLSTARLYVQLARHRTEIEAEKERLGELSLRAARRLIRKSSPKSAKPPKPSLLAAWDRATHEERTAALSHIGLADFLQVMPNAWRAEMAARVRNLHSAESTDPADKMTTVLRKALSHIKAANTAGVSEAVAANNKNEALASMRMFLTLLMRDGIDLNDVSVGAAKTEPKSRRRAA